VAGRDGQAWPGCEQRVQLGLQRVQPAVFVQELRLDGSELLSELVAGLEQLLVFFVQRERLQVFQLVQLAQVCQPLLERSAVRQAGFGQVLRGLAQGEVAPAGVGRGLRGVWEWLQTLVGVWVGQTAILFGVRAVDNERFGAVVQVLAVDNEWVVVLEWLVAVVQVRAVENERFGVVVQVLAAV